MASTRIVVEYLDSNGASPFAKWFTRLDSMAAAKVTTALYRMEQGNLSNVKPVGSGVAEYRIHYGPGYRLYIGQQGNVLVILLGGGTKKGQCEDIRLARQRWCDYKTRIIEVNAMPITREFRETIRARAQADARFRAAMLTEAINELLAGDLATGKALLRDYVNATLTFDRLTEATGIPVKSLQRMLGPRGNPTAMNLFAVIKALQDAEHITLAVKTTRRAA
jgi:putative addiction module killer protein